jgi:hypothetical protein
MLGLGGQRQLAGRLAANQVAAHRDEAVAALRPQRCDDAGASCSPIEAGDERLLDLERVQEGDGVDGERRLLAVAHGLVGAEARAPVAAQVRHDHAVLGRGQRGGDVDVAVDVVRPAVQQEDRRAVGGTELDVADVQEAGVDLPDGAERGVRRGGRLSSGCRRHLVS